MDLEWTTGEYRLPKKKLLTRKEVCAALEIGPAALKELMAEGTFPRPIGISGRTHRWRAAWVGIYLLYLEEYHRHLEAGEVAETPEEK